MQTDKNIRRNKKMDKQKYLDLIEKYQANDDVNGLLGLLNELSPKINYAMDNSGAAECNQYVEVNNRLADVLNPYILEFRKRSGQNIPLMQHLETVFSERR
jgi:hypothetical protein